MGQLRVASDNTTLNVIPQGPTQAALSLDLGSDAVCPSFSLGLGGHEHLHKG